MTFSDTDINQIKNHGLTIETITKQLQNFQTGFPFINIVRPASSTNGVKQLSDSETENFINIYDEYAKKHKIVKFVPASGAATRMFKDLFDFLTSGLINPTTEKVLKNIESFAFWNSLKEKLPKNASDTDVIKYILTDIGLNYGNSPKGLVLFHNYTDETRPPVCEHLIEGFEYAKSANTINIHFTISPEHKSEFEQLLSKIIPEYEKKYNCKYNITMSEQKSSTDTIAVNMDNTPFRNDDGSLLFRPAGHGALIENLNDIDADLIFIKNIDNVTTSNNRKDTTKYKKALAGILVKLQQQIFNFIKDIDSENYNIEEIHNFITNNLGIKFDKNLTLSEYRSILNRPLRVCGVVRNIGAPGGGPFWVQDKNNNTSLQIVESSQIAPESLDIMKKSEYFNPVDLVCATRDFQNKKFNLPDFIDENTGFISKKSKNGIDLRAMERPGLWNGSMANWNTVLVEVPITTFTPVKVVTDLLSDTHQTK